MSLISLAHHDRRLKIKTHIMIIESIFFIYLPFDLPNHMHIKEFRSVTSRIKKKGQNQTRPQNLKTVPPVAVEDPKFCFGQFCANFLREVVTFLRTYKSTSEECFSRFSCQHQIKWSHESDQSIVHLRSSSTKLKGLQRVNKKK